MRRFYALLLKVLAAALLWPVDMSGQQTPVQPTWESLNERGYPEWFSDSKLGIFVHWGLYSVPAYASKEGYGEWFYRGLMQHVPERMRIMSYYADTTKPVFDQYKELTKHWHGELWNPDEWAQLFKDAGAKYVVLVTKHHDGYCLWDSKFQPEWNSVASGPKRNIVGELTNAVRKNGLRMGFYYSLPEWSNPRHIWMEDPDDSIGDYVDLYMVPQFKELVSRYKPDLLFSDGDWNNTAEQLRSQELISWYYNTVGADAIVNNRWGNGTKHGFLTPEYSAGITNTEVPWAECRGLGRSFGLNRNEDLDNYLTDKELILHFAELVAHGGGMTLNVGPYADGTIPLIQQERLKSLGNWLKINGEAIYGTRPYIIQCQREKTSAELPPTESIDFDWVRNAPMRGVSTDHFDIQWRGTVTIPEDGKYTFAATADDTMKVSCVDGIPLA
ncbi:MAG: alpha-L-fucosidase, partial [Bacteroidales bacterium]|nr:alpha-L-fucosidase [Bacteroidales bacterium]